MDEDGVGAGDGQGCEETVRSRGPFHLHGTLQLSLLPGQSRRAQPPLALPGVVVHPGEGVQEGRLDQWLNNDFSLIFNWTWCAKKLPKSNSIPILLHRNITVIGIKLLVVHAAMTVGSWGRR